MTRDTFQRRSAEFIALWVYQESVLSTEYHAMAQVPLE